MHIHLYGRVQNETYQSFPEALHFPPLESGFYNNLKPITNEDIKEIQKQLAILEKTDKFDIRHWMLLK